MGGRGQKRDATNDEEPSTTTDTSSSSSSSTPAKRKKKMSKAELLLEKSMDPTKEQLAEALATNRDYYAALILSSADDMVEMACLNISNRGNMQLLEWSECVLIQICNLSTLIDFKKYVWTSLMEFVNRHEWVMPLHYCMNRFVGSCTLLSQKLIANRKYKSSISPMSDVDVFIKQPPFNYTALKMYNVTFKEASRSLGSNQQFKFKKKNRAITTTSPSTAAAVVGAVGAAATTAAAPTPPPLAESKVNSTTPN